MTLKLGSLFSGYGGLDSAVHAAFGDVETRWVSDIEPGPIKLLSHRFPDVPNLGDITQIDWDDVEPVDIIAGGSPCQDISAAGKRAGMRPGTRSGLWESMREAIAVIKPAFVVWENVLGALSAGANSDSELEYDKGPLGGGTDGPALRAIGRVLGDLSTLGYDSQWTSLRASAIGACHHRDRVFLLAVRRGVPTDALRSRARWRSSEPGQSESERTNGQVELSDPSPSRRVVVLPTPLASEVEKGYFGERKSKGQLFLSNVIATEYLPTPKSTGNQWGKYAAAIRRWEHARGVPAPDPTVVSPSTDRPVLSPMFTEWMMGLPSGWIADVPGITRAEAIRACGNGVVPQQGATALTWLIDQARKWEAVQR